MLEVLHARLVFQTEQDADTRTAIDQAARALAAGVAQRSHAAEAPQRVA